MPRLFLHVGQPKTATTSIQRFLLHNKDALANHGVLYPGAALQHIAHHPLGNFFRPDPLDWIGIRDPATVKKNLFNEMKARGCDDVIMSSESLIYAPQLDAMHEYFSEFEVFPVFFLRRQDQWIQAVFRQEVQNGAVRPDRVHYLKHRLHALDYLGKLEQWARVFGADNIKVAVFDKGKERIPVEKMFLEAIGLKLWDDLALAGIRNETLSRDCLAFLDAMPTKRKIGVKFSHYFNILEQFSKINPDPPEWKNIWPPAERLAILESVSVSNAKVARNFLGREDGLLFPSPPPRLDEPWEEYPGLEMNKSVEIASFLADTLIAISQKKG